MKAIFLADAHLRQPQDDNYQKILAFLEQQEDLDALFLLGDIFEFWVGYQHLVFSAYVPLLEQLRRLVAGGTRLYYVEGNHDFLLGPYFSETLNCTVITEQQLIEWDGKKLLLNHGDLINPGQGYLLLRNFWRSAPVRILTRLLHPDLLWRFALWLSDRSRDKRLQSKSWDPSPLLQPLADSANGKNADIILCGHFHQPVQNEYQGKQLIVVGDWIRQYSYAEMIDGRIELKSYAS